MTMEKTTFKKYLQRIKKRGEAMMEAGNKARIWGLRVKLFIFFLGLVAFAGVLLITVLVRRSSAFLEEQAIRDINSNLASFELLVEKETQVVELVVQVAKAYPGLAEAVASADREVVAKVLLPLFEELKKEAGITNLQINDSRLHVFFRAHNPDKYGDDASFRSLLRAVLAQQRELSGIDIGVSGMAARAAAPLYDGEGRIIGVVEAGKVLDNDYLDALKADLKVDLTVFYQDERIATTVQTAAGERAVGTKITHPEVLRDVLGAGGSWSGRLIIVGGKDIFGAYSALRDMESNVIGMLFAGLSAESYELQRKEDLQVALTMLLFCLLLAAAAAFVLSGRIVGPITELSRLLKQVAGGDFTVEVKNYGSDEVGAISKAVAGMLSDLRALFSNVVSSVKRVEQLSVNVSETVGNISASIQDVASSANEVAAAAGEMSTSSQEMAGYSNEVAGKAEEGEKEIGKAFSQMKAIGESFQELAGIIGRLGDRSRNIGEIVKVINEISEQTNLLALNAAIEAARAGEYGRGFTVVAEEVRKLAERAAQSAKEIERLILETQNDAAAAVSGMRESAAAVEEGQAIMHQSAARFSQIIQSIRGLLTKIESVAASAEELSASSQQVAASTEEQSAAAEEIGLAARELRAAAEKLDTEIGRFRF